MDDKDAQTAFREFLAHRFETAKVKNPLYSMRAFSRRVKLSSSAVSEILKGKRRVSPKLASRIGMNLGVEATEISNLLALFNCQERTRKSRATIRRIELDLTRYQIVSHWVHFGILALMETKDFKQSPRWIADRLGLELQEIETAIERMLELGMITVNPKGKWELGSSPFQSTDGIHNPALQKAHERNLDLAKKSLLTDPYEIRDFTSTTFAIQAEKIPEARIMIRKFQDRLSAFLEKGERDQVYKVCIQLFPLTRSSHRAST